MSAEGVFATLCGQGQGKSCVNTFREREHYLSVKLLCVWRTVMIKYIFLLFAGKEGELELCN